ncbi:MAG: hypothetical protein WCX84_03960 [Syntrophales bacterium]|jgi:hypothetical protein|nr:hypothetical protein [Syntrophales bacterium]
MIKTDEMVHMGMGNKDMADLEQVTGCQAAQVTQIEQQGFPPVSEFHKNPGILKGIIDQSDIEHKTVPPVDENTRHFYFAPQSWNTAISPV